MRAIRGELPTDPSSDAEPYPSDYERPTPADAPALPASDGAPALIQLSADFAPNPIEVLTKLVADAQRSGVRVRIVIEPIE